MKIRTILASGMLIACSAGISAQEQNRARAATPRDIVEWASKIQMDYPAAALMNLEQGTVVMKISVGTDGTVTECEVTGSSGSEALDSAACKGMLDHAQYTPARNKAGELVATVTQQAIRYILPESDRTPRSFLPPVAMGMDSWRELAFDAEFKRKILQIEGGDGTALYALTVDHDGKASGCGVMQSSGSSELDNGACKSLLENAKFKPSWVDGAFVHGFFAVPYPSYDALKNVRSQ